MPHEATLPLDTRALWAARREGGVLPQPDDLSETDAYAMQDALIATASTPLAGWKVGATGAGAPEALGLSGPLSGPLWADAIWTGGATIPLYEAHRPKAEVELAVRMKGAPRGQDARSVFDAVEAAALAIEVTGSRLSDDLDPAGPGFIADHGGANHVILGDFAAPPPPEAWPDLAASLLIDGAEVACGTGANVLGSPVAALAWLSGHLGARGLTLKEGDVIITGAIVGLTDFRIGAELSAQARALPFVSARTSEASR